MSVRRRLRVVIFGWILGSASAVAELGATTPALAEVADKAKVAVGGFSGDKNGELRDAFLSALRDDGRYELTDAEDVKSTANAHAVADAASAMGVSVVITGKVSGASLKLKLMGSSGEQLDTPEIKSAGRAKLKANIRKSAASSVARGIDRAVAAERAKAEKEARASERRERPRVKAEEESDDSRGGLSPLDLTAGLRAMHRTFTFNQTIAELRPNDGFGKLLRYKLPLGPVVFVDVNWYPGAHFAKGQAERIGISAGYEKGFAISTVYEPTGGQKRTLTTNEQGYYLGARYRLPLGLHELGAQASFGQHTFELSGDAASPLVPDVKYTYLKLGLDGSLSFGDLSLAARIGKRFVLDTGSLETVWFPGSVKTTSLEAGLTLGYRLLPTLEVVAGFDWLRYAFDFNPVQQRVGNESLVAGGAVDQYWYASLGARFRLPGQAPATSEQHPAADDDDDE
jgi:hypothetical protein